MKQEVEYWKYCKDCRHEKNEETEEPCDSCLNEPINEDSQKPLYFSKKFERIKLIKGGK